MCHILFDAWYKKWGWNLEKSRIFGTFPKDKRNERCLWPEKNTFKKIGSKFFSPRRQKKKETSLQEDAMTSSPALSCSVLLHVPKSMIIFSDTYLPVSTRCSTPGHCCSVFPPLSLMDHLSCLFQKENFPLFKFRGLVTLLLFKEDHWTLTII